MTILRAAAATAALGAAIFGAAPAAAVVETFATFTVIGTASNLRYASNGNSSVRTLDAFIFSTAVSNGPASSVLVKFSFNQPAFVAAGIAQNITAVLTFDATVAKGSNATPVSTVAGTSFSQPGISGTFSIRTLNSPAGVINVGGPLFSPFSYGPNANLLSGSFGGADITGKIGGTSGALAGSTGGGDTVNFTSDFLDFSNTVNRDFSLALTSVISGFAERTGNNKALNNFRANASGQFSSDPAPIINGLTLVPEPAVWAMLVVGFGLVGVQTRRRNRPTSVTA